MLDFFLGGEVGGRGSRVGAHRSDQYFVNERASRAC